MNEETEAKLIEHIEEYPKRRAEMRIEFDDIRSQIREGLLHPAPAQETLNRLMAGDERMARIERSLIEHTIEERRRDDDAIENNNKRLDKQDKILEEILAQAKKTNGRVNKLEEWKTATVNFAKGMHAGGKGTWIGIATVVGIGWVVFGEFIQRKIGLK